MSPNGAPGGGKVVQRADFGALFSWLHAEGFTIVGPTVHESAIVYDELGSVDDLPAGWTDEQDGGRYRLTRRPDDALFGYAVGPHSWKKYLFPSRRRLWKAERRNGKITFREEPLERVRYAFLGVRSCELHAIAIQDKVFLDERHADPLYASRRADLFIVAVNCHTAGGTCFCASMRTGPRCSGGFDVVVTEIVSPGRHEFVLEPGSERGRALVGTLPGRAAGDRDEETVAAIARATTNRMGRTLDTSDIKELLYRNFEHPRWNEVAARCLTCGNCTMACPTCFCSTVEDTVDLEGDHAERWQRWDSCFQVDFSFLHGGAVRPTPVSRYRQWMTHKLATWIDQFGSSGCVGCGRCITWCPVGIDITEEVEAIRKTGSSPAESS